MRLNKRERNMALMLGIFFAGWLLYTTLVEPASARAATLRRVIPEKMQSLETLKAKCAELTALDSQLSSLKKQRETRKKNFNLMAYLETLTAHHDLTKHQKSMAADLRPLNDIWQEKIVTITFENITIKQMVDLLTQVQSDQTGARINAINVDKNVTDPKNLDAMLQIATLQSTGKS